MQKKAKNIEIGDILICNEDEHMLVHYTTRGEYTIHVYGFVNNSTIITDKYYEYSDVLTVVEKKRSLIDKMLEFIKCRIS